MKSSRTKSLGFVVLAILIVSTAALAVEIPLTNWTVPAYHSSGSSGGITTMTDVTQGNGFVGVTPCRLVDTRVSTSPNFPVPYGPPSLGAGTPRNFDLNNDPKCTGIPAAQAYSLNITVTNTQGPGFILIYPQGGAQPTVSTLNYIAGQTVANAAIVPAGTGGGVTVIAGVSGADLIIDINGYFTISYNDGNALEAIGNVGSFFLPGALVVGSNANAGSAAYGVFGLSSGTGTTVGGGSAGVAGWGLAASGAGSGVFGLTSSTGNGAAGVLGLAQDGTDNDDINVGHQHGGPAVKGYTLTGQAMVGVVSGSGSGEAITGIVGNGAGVALSQGYLGYSSLTAVRAEGNISKSGTVSFTEPHPTDASKKVIYVALEGNEAGTYFRGRGKFQNGTASINLPEDFRMVTQPEGLSIQVTPIGDMATVAVMSIGLDRIVVKGSRNVEFFYTVNGIRRGYGNFQPIIAADKDYLPDQPDARLPETLSAEIRSRLIANGTYKLDGTVNMETAQRLGWDRVWAENAAKVGDRPAMQNP